MKKSKLFVENMLVFGFGGVISKLIPIIMVPIVTRLFPDTTYYGLSDLCSTMLSFGRAIAVMGMYDAMFRLFFDREDDLDHQKRVCSTAIGFTILTSLCVFLIMVVLQELLSKFVFKDSQYTYLVLMAAVGSAITGTNTIMGAPTRMQNKRKTYLIVNALVPCIAYSLAIVLILRGYYIIAIPLATIIADTCVIIIYYFLNRQWFSIKKFDRSILPSLLKMSIPLAPTFLIYWIFSSSDKIMISNLLDVAQVGIYTAGAKLGHCSQIIYLAFSGGWSYFAFKTMKDKDQVETRARILEYLGALSFVTGIFVFALCKPLCAWFFDGDYEKGYIVAPYLFMAPLMQMLFQVNANQFTIRKQTWLTTVTLLVGAVFNVVLNYFMIPIMGIEGAALASMLGYIISTAIAIAILLHLKLIRLSNRFLLTIIITVGYILIWRFLLINNAVISTILAAAIAMVFFVLYRTDLKAILESLIPGKMRKA
ncbi:Membrane protein involved in the export of O-antigen and teichoic acid [[Clostridium] aminophilum]|uniref:Membrane protein involved in the export of O-antigen and teichoic acid n=1 Tax=[Clostridium] aminophilum TaxID=1526 RepID=A0A1I0FHY4_9FIRM|nr:oligosaccharide flippase family protein [[Clostridium] aminophilum]SET57928.1 Membrane protein involved in the export of O-antigen and teichoic acid [[Clostridium] aminophilum]